MRHLNLLIPLLAACAVEPSPDVETTTQALETGDYGFALSNQLTGTSTPSPSFSANSGGGPITIQNLTTGNYLVTFAGLGGPGGNAHVVAFGGDSTRCKLSGWFPSGSGSDEYVLVNCHTPAGVAINSRFVVRYGRGSTSTGAYVFADKPTAASYTANAAYSYNSTGGTNTITRSATGTYVVHLPGLGSGSDQGNVLVTAYGGAGAHCNVRSYLSFTPTRPIHVRCWSPTGELVDSKFTLLYDAPFVTGYNEMGAYALANDPTSSSYVPSASYSYNSGFFGCGDAGSNSAGRFGTGSYFMRHTKVTQTDSTVHVTAVNFAGSPNYCKVTAWLPDDGVEVWVRCFDASGAPVDSQYAESYYTSNLLAPC